MSDQPTAQVRCEEHHWVSSHQPDLPIYWIRQCSQCGYYDPESMTSQIESVYDVATLRAEVERLRMVQTMGNATIERLTRERGQLYMENKDLRRGQKMPSEAQEGPSKAATADWGPSARPETWADRQDEPT